MKALVLGGRGAVGEVVVARLRSHGHEVTAAGRRSGDTRIDLAGADGPDQLAALASSYDVIVNASGVENPGVVDAIGATPFVDVSAIASYLAALRNAARDGQSILLGAGLAPGLTTLLVSELSTEEGDDVDVAIILGTGEQHGPAAVEWTAGLIGSVVHDPPDPGPVLNLRETRKLPSPNGYRSYLRADFPDHLLAASTRGISVRSYLAVGGRATTAALSAAGRLPQLAPLLDRAPHIGDDKWSLTALNRRTGLQLSVRGEGQSRSTGALTAHAAEALHDALPGSVVTTPDVTSLGESVSALD